MAETVFASWTHGCSAVAESRETQVLYQGFGATFSRAGAGADWLHIPIPTPVLVRNDRARISKAFCLFNATAGAVVRDIQVFDGRSRIASRAGEINITGDHLGIDPPSVSLGLRNWTLFTGPPEIFWGLSMTLRVEFANAGSKLFISTAGADLLVDG